VRRCKPPQAGRCQPTADRHARPPEVALLGPTPARIEHRHDGLVGKDPRRRQHDLAQPRHHRGDLGGGVAGPERKCRAVDRHTLALDHLRLPIQRLVIGKAPGQHVRDQRFGRNPALDQPGRRRLLHDDALAGAASQIRPPGDQDPELRRDHVQPFRFVFADNRHHPATARARG
jgi:hypothetical protein